MFLLVIFDQSLFDWRCAVVLRKEVMKFVHDGWEVFI